MRALLDPTEKERVGKQLKECEEEIQQLKDKLKELTRDSSISLRDYLAERCSKSSDELSPAERRYHSAMDTQSSRTLSVSRRFEGRSGNINCLTLSQSDDSDCPTRITWVSAGSPTMTIWNYSKGSIVGRVDLNGRWAQCCAMSRDGSLLGVGGWSDSIKIFDIATIQPLRQPQTTLLNDFDGDLVFNLEFVDQSQVISGDGGGNIIVWDTSQGKKIRAFPFVFNGDIYDAHFNHGTGLYAAGSADGTVKVFDLREPSDYIVNFRCFESRDFSSSLDNINCVRWLPDASSLICGGDSGIIHLMDMRSHRRIARYGTDINQRCLLSLESSKTGRYIIASYDGRPTECCIWNTLEGTVDQKLDHFDGAVRSICLGPDSGDSIITACDDSSIRVWT